MNDEVPMMKKVAARMAHSGLGMGHSFVIHHSSFAI